MLRVVGTGVLENGHSFYLVPSESDPGKFYVVEQLPVTLTCTCKDHFYRGRRCKHIAAVVEHKERLQLAAIQRETAAIVAGVRESLNALADAMSSTSPVPVHPQSHLNRTEAFHLMK